MNGVSGDADVRGDRFSWSPHRRHGLPEAATA
eukprot:CAMPEP_0182569058 /NCGR_PEP_ID=MMETSP1324-20130603/9806_1 /TAXON_ID=236786 /ORGANISM="Florenciella sp., Strain RCC1587" /LENGTH=31 /DNA_ID= /DNA_START= /DNA_END= /DNA_ORIENTATION=